MSRALEDYRSVQIDIRLLTLALGIINDEEKGHPEKCTEHDSLAVQAKWAKRKAVFAKRRESIKKQLTDKQERRDMLYLNLSQTPVSMLSLAEFIESLTKVEAVFATDGANDAWDKLSAFIDYLDEDAARVKELKAA